MPINLIITINDLDGISDSTGQGNRLVVAQNVIVSSQTGRGVNFDYGAGQIQVYGSVLSATSQAIYMGSFFNPAVGSNFLNVGVGGVVASAGDVAAFMSGDQNRVFNSGEISTTMSDATGAAVSFGGNDGQITNSGVISSTVNGVVFSGSGGTVVNSGTISASGVALQFQSGSSVTNTGLIVGNTATGVAFISNSGVDTFTNHGQIVGTMTFNDGDDLLDNTGGIVIGRIWFGVGNDELIGGASTEKVMGSTGADALDFGAGDDVFIAGNLEAVPSDDDDELDGGDGIDTYDARDLSNAITVRLTELRAVGTDIGHDVVLNFENIFGGLGNDTLVGDTGSNLLRGGFGNDTMNGLEGSDRLVGFLGSDILIGGTGRDVMTGGLQNDTFDFNSVADSAVGDARRDIITDFLANSDVIDLATIDANTVLAGNQAFTFIGTGDFTNVAGQFRYSISAATSYTTVEGDVNGDGKADFQIGLLGSVTLTAVDFAL